MKNHARNREAANDEPRDLHPVPAPRPLHDADGTGICKARGCRAGPGHGPCRAFMPAAGRAPAAAAVQAGPVPPMLVDVRGAMKILRLGRCTILALASAGEISELRFGRAVRYPLSDLEDLVRRRKYAGQLPGSHPQAG